jgi:hypothetical protein
MSEKYGIVSLPQEESQKIKMNHVAERQGQMRDLQFDYYKILNKQ